MDIQQRDEIISYACKVITQTGVKSLRMDDVAQATRTSKRTLYETFGDKEELIFQACKKHFDIFEASNIKAAKDADNILIAMIIVMEEVRKNANLNWQIRSSLKRFYPQISERLLNENADEKLSLIQFEWESFKVILIAE